MIRFCLFEDRGSGHCTTSNHPYKIRYRSRDRHVFQNHLTKTPQNNLGNPVSLCYQNPQDKNILPKTHTREQANRPSWRIQFGHQNRIGTQIIARPQISSKPTILGKLTGISFLLPKSKNRVIKSYLKTALSSKKTSSKTRLVSKQW